MKVLISYIIILLPILENQPIFSKIPVTLTYLLGVLFIFSIIIVSTKKRIITINRAYIIFLTILIITNLINITTIHIYGDGGNVVKGLINAITFFLTISLVLEYIDIKLFYKSLSKVCNVISLQIIIQYILFYILKKRTNFYILGIKLFTDNLYEFYRPSGIFSEPSHLANFFAIAIILSLYNSNNKKAIFYTIISILTTSNNAILFSVLIWIFYIIRRKNIKHVIIMCIVAISLFNTNSPVINSVKDRLITGGSYNARITRGKVIFDALDKKEKIIGVGLQNVGMYTKSKEIITKYDEINGRHTEFMSTVWYFFVSSGVIVGVTFLIFIIYLLINSNYFTKMLSLIFFLICFTSNVFTSFIWCLYLVIILKIRKKDNFRICLNRGYII